MDEEGEAWRASRQSSTCAVVLNVTFDTKEEVRAAFDALSAGAKAVLYAPRVTAYSSCHSSLVDDSACAGR
ncbi:MAG: hypothetical protein ACI4XW_01675 [Candidatus Spyradocola sp.]